MDPAATLRILNHIASEHLKTLGKIQQEVTGDPDRLTSDANRFGQQATQVTGVARLLAEQRESLSPQWWGFAGQTFQSDAKGLVEKLAVVENGLRRERNRLNSASRLVRRAMSTVDEAIASFTAKANELIGNVGCVEPNSLITAMMRAGNAAVRQSLAARTAANKELGTVFTSSDVSLGLPYDAWRAGKEYDSLVNYTQQEMVNNAQSAAVERMKYLNQSSFADVVRANMEWYDKVAPGHEWDHKPKINELYELKQRGVSEYQGSRDFYSPVPASPAGRPPAGISYQVWSNIHYGYVGLEAGFSERWLQRAAGGEDYFMRFKTDPGDVAAIEIGAQLRRDYPPDVLRPEHINDAIMRRYDDLVKYGKIRPTPAWER